MTSMTDLLSFMTFSNRSQKNPVSSMCPPVPMIGIFLLAV